ncbi:Golgi apparatus protein 1-like [Dreissena polymorpha]|nr:Golgi apparatus protein 1-like [Dreissena polymorpha]
MAEYARRVHAKGPAIGLNMFCYVLLIFCTVLSVSGEEPAILRAQKDAPDAAHQGERINPKFNLLQNMVPSNQPLNSQPNLGRRQAPPDVGIKTDARNNVLLSSHPDCMEDVVMLCNATVMRMNNFAILDCLQQDVAVQTRVSEKCQHLVWEYKQNLTKDDRFESGANEVCKKVFEENPECHALPAGVGQRIPCLIEVMDNVTDPGCHRFLTKMANIVFGDYQLVWHFMENCKDDINSFKCGRLDNDPDKMHSQGKTILCLARQIGMLKNPECRKQVLRVAELQSDDYHMDRSLYYACRDAREMFCGQVHSGNGKVFECLFKNKMHPEMPSKCKDLLQVRQKLIAEDVKVEKSFYDACHADIIKNKCIAGMDTAGGHAQRSTILLCLENGLKQGVKPAGECMTQMSLLRKSLMEDYQITPEIVSNCGLEIDKFCRMQAGLDEQGGTIHCLMQMANPRERDRKNQKDHPHAMDPREDFRPECKAALEDLLKEADVAEDASVDGVLMTACSKMINGECKGKIRTELMNCLIENIDADDMTEPCEDKLIEIQYFIVRDFRLDADLYKQCHEDAVNLCKAPNDWWANKGNKATAETDPDVFPCLYRHLPNKLQEHKQAMMDHDDNDDDEEEFKPDELPNPLSRQCEQEVRRVMRHRAKSIDLEPSLEAKCLTDLAVLCSDLEHYGKGKELKCLQDRYEDINDKKCKAEVRKFIRDEDEDLDLDTILMKACTPMIKRFCEGILDNNADASNVMNCLIENKNHRDMNSKCKAGIEHHQIIQMKDYTFSHKFREACKKDVLEHCRKSQTKADVVSCLSEIVRNNILLEQSHNISQDCREVLKIDLLQMSENIDLDPALKQACGEDLKQFCKGKHNDDGQATECLRENKKSLSAECHKMVFKRQLDEVNLDADFSLFRTCKQMIKKHCSHKDNQDMLSCLKQHLDELGHDDPCKKMVLKRAMESTKDYRMNPKLAKACRRDIPKFCKEDLQHQKEGEEFEGQIINCLKKQFTKKALSNDCADEIRLVIKESHMDINMDPVLMRQCRIEIRSLCQDALGEHDVDRDQLLFQPQNTDTRVKTCLEEKFKEGKIEPKSSCGVEISRWQLEVQIDVHIDPELNQLCTVDLVKWCREYETGQGQKMSCLLQTLEDYPNKLKPECKKVLERRKTLWEFAAKVAPVESLSEVHELIMQSPARHYLLGVLVTILGVIFVVGITCGRVTKRVTREQKTK